MFVLLKLKKTSAIFFLTVYLFAATEAHQLTKLPVIFQHFAEHTTEDNSITFLQFIDMHYMHGSPKDKDQERDLELPFKTTHDCVTSNVPVLVPVTLELSIEKPTAILKKVLANPQDSFLISAYLANIWQPPKSC